MIHTVRGMGICPSKKSSKAGLTFSLQLSVLYALFFVISSGGLFVVAYYLIDNLIEQREQEIVRDRIPGVPGMV